jgi:hypothetical protein
MPWLTGSYAGAFGALPTHRQSRRQAWRAKRSTGTWRSGATSGFDLVALAELAVAIEDAIGIGIEMTDLDSCRTVGNLEALVAAKGCIAGKGALAAL